MVRLNICLKLLFLWKGCKNSNWRRIIKFTPCLCWCHQAFGVVPIAACISQTHLKMWGSVFNGDIYRWSSFMSKEFIEKNDKWEKTNEGKGFTKNIWKAEGMQLKNEKKIIVSINDGFDVCGEKGRIKLLIVSNEKIGFIKLVLVAGFRSRYIYTLISC